MGITDQPRHRAIVRISYDFLAGLLFPEGTSVVALIQDVNDIYGRMDYVAVIEHPDLPGTMPGSSLPYVKPTYRRVSGDDSDVQVVQFEGWGI